MIRPLTDEDTDWVPEKRQRTEVVTDNNHIPKTPHLKARNLLNHLREYTFTPAVDKFTEYLRWYEKKNGAPSPLSSSRSVTYVHTCLYMDYYASFFCAHVTHVNHYYDYVTLHIMPTLSIRNHQIVPLGFFGGPYRLLCSKPYIPLRSAASRTYGTLIFVGTR